MEACCDYYNQTLNLSLEKENFLVTTGESEALLFAFAATCNPGDEIIVFEPYYANYNGFANLLNIKLVPFTTHLENGFALPSAEKISEKI